jgi:hypothetical protein
LQRLVALEAEVKSLEEEDDQKEIDRRLGHLEQKKHSLISKRQVESLDTVPPKRRPAPGIPNQSPTSSGNFSINDVRSIVSEVARVTNDSGNPPPTSTTTPAKMISGAYAKISDSIVHHPIAYPHMGIQVDAFKREEAGNLWTGMNLDSRLFVAGYITNLLGDLVLNESEDPSTYFDRVRIVRDHKLPFLMYENVQHSTNNMSCTAFTVRMTGTWFSVM